MSTEKMKVEFLICRMTKIVKFYMNQYTTDEIIQNVFIGFLMEELNSYGFRTNYKAITLFL